MVLVWNAVTDFASQKVSSSGHFLPQFLQAKQVMVAFWNVGTGFVSQ